MTNYLDKSNWSTDGANILSTQNLDAVRSYLEKVGHIAVLHWHFLGGRAPTPLAFDNFDEFESFLRTDVHVGDAIDVWPFPSRTGDQIAAGKYPNADGEIPLQGAY